MPGWACEQPRKTTPMPPVDQNVWRRRQQWELTARNSICPDSLVQDVRREIQPFLARSPLEKTTGLLVNGRDAASSRELLQVRGIRWHEVPVGSYTLFVVARPENEKETLDSRSCTGPNWDVLPNVIPSRKPTRSSGKRLIVEGGAIKPGRLIFLHQSLQFYPFASAGAPGSRTALRACGQGEPAST